MEETAECRLFSVHKPVPKRKNILLHLGWLLDAGIHAIHSDLRTNCRLSMVFIDSISTVNFLDVSCKLFPTDFLFLCCEALPSSVVTAFRLHTNADNIKWYV